MTISTFLIKGFLFLSVVFTSVVSLEAGRKPRTRSVKVGKKYKPIHDAIRIQPKGYILELIEKSNLRQLNSTSRNKGLTPLHLACSIKANAYDIVDALLNKDVNINKKDREGRTPLLLLLNKKKRDRKIFIRLLYGRAVVDLKDNNGRSTLHLLAKQRGNSSDNSSVEILSIFKAFDIKLDPNLKDNAGKTPLLVAVECNHYELVPHLLEMGADPSIADCEGNSALSLVTQKGDYEIAFEFNKYVKS